MTLHSVSVVALVALIIVRHSQCQISEDFMTSGAAGNTLSVKSKDVSSRIKRYVLYDVNHGEGFNLKRDVFVRVAPIIKSLNDLDRKSQWILVLHPWGHLVHWSESNYFPWKTFFDINEIQKYIPAIEFQSYLEDHGLDNVLDGFYQLQHFPLNSPTSKSWRENVKVVPCENDLRFIRESSSDLFSGSSWTHTFYSKNATCLGVKGYSWNVVNFLMSLEARAIFLDKAEVILWDHYGGSEWWEARKSLKYASHLQNLAMDWVKIHIPHFNLSDLRSSGYMGVHLRRKDFVQFQKNQPSLQDVANQIVHHITVLRISYVFIATDGNESEFNALQYKLDDISTTKVNLYRFNCSQRNLSDGECAIIDQIICSWSKYFIGTEVSTFTLRIFEERELLGVDPVYNYNLICTGKLQCAKGTRWPIE